MTNRLKNRQKSGQKRQKWLERLPLMREIAGSNNHFRKLTWNATIFTTTTGDILRLSSSQIITGDLSRIKFTTSKGSLPQILSTTLVRLLRIRFTITVEDRHRGTHSNVGDLHTHVGDLHTQTWETYTLKRGRLGSSMDASYLKLISQTPQAEECEAQ
ncbi:hypothetical protein CHS0354_020504 [Potamilus streckersoni]|uniref:Uncharacterized protein n=1 Tax=Potamilus streckersoni TaxID=2493646 RepID=A0AAE0W3L2_9BIVA|nr:hypothetical protein CHS0354_020504 [Potamilus streckersoni]